MSPQSEHSVSAAPETNPATGPCSSPTYPAVLLRVLAGGGYGLWMLLGLALALGIYRDGRSEALVPLALGGIFVSAGLLAACLRVPSLGLWHGWRPAERSWPTGEALLALATYLPMLAVAGLVRGDNTFWATRLAGAILLLCSVVSLIYTVHGDRRRLASSAQHLLAQLPATRMVSAWYGGGLWLWLCMATQDGGMPPGAQPWIMALLLLALLLGLIEGLRWQALLGSDRRRSDTRARTWRPARFVAAVFTYAIPSVVLLLIDLSGTGPLLIAVAAISSLLGRTIEQRAYEATLAEPHAR